MRNSSPLTPVSYRTPSLDDAEAIAVIYNQGIEDRVATFETEPRSAAERRQWLGRILGHYPAVVAMTSAEVVGWAAVGPYSSRDCYRGIGEFSVYVRRDLRGHGIGGGLLDALVGDAERLGLWKLVSRVFTFNAASRALCKAHGFREVGIHEKHAKLDGKWLDVVVVELLIPSNVQ